MDQPAATAPPAARSRGFMLGCFVGAAVGSLAAGVAGFFAGIAATREGLAILTAEIG